MAFAVAAALVAVGGVAADPVVSQSGQQASAASASVPAIPSHSPVMARATRRGPSAGLCRDVQRGALLALTLSGDVAVVDLNTRTAEGTFARDVAVGEGMAAASTIGTVYVTGRGPDGRPAVWVLACGHEPRVLAIDAELPAVSPDDHALAFVTLGAAGRQSGVAVASLAKSGLRLGHVKRLPATSVPPPLPIDGLALGPKAETLAVWGGFVDPHLARGTTTTGTLDPRAARTLSSLRPIETFASISIVAPAPGGHGHNHRPRSGTRAAVYLPDGLVIVGSDVNVGMPWNPHIAPGEGGGFRLLAGSTGRINSLAAGPTGEVAWVTADGRMSFTTTAWNFPFGPWASTPYSPPPPKRIDGRYSAVAWTVGRSRTATVPPPAYHPVVMPNVTNMPEPQAVDVLDHLEIPSWVSATVSRPTVPPDTVVSQDTPPGVGMACQCSVGLTVSAGGAPVTALLPKGASGYVRNP